MTKALFFDIDGTLVSFNTHRIPSSTIEALEAAHAKGIKIFIATGRPQSIINNLSELQDRKLIDGYITMNGAYCFVEKEVIYKSPVCPDEVQAVAHFAKKKGFPAYSSKNTVYPSVNPMTWYERFSSSFYRWTKYQ
jgi:HAD superfamily hydrolase (TIGR01484 family)